MATKKSTTTPKKATAKKPSLVKRVVDKINKKTDASESKTTVEFAKYDAILGPYLNTYGLDKQFFMNNGFKESHLPDIGEEKKYGKYSLKQVFPDKYIILE